MRAALLLLLVACTTHDKHAGPGDAAVVAPDVAVTACAVENVTGTLPGVSISIFSDSCTYRRGQPATFTFRVVTTNAVPAIDVPATSSCDCDYRTTQIASWVGWIINGTSTTGENQQYCFCDTGCCAPQAMQTITPEVGTYEDTITWSGHTWFGPSDTGNAEGDAFLVGSYAVLVGFTGYAEGSVSAMLPIQIVP